MTLPIVYEVTLDAEPAVADALAQYMRTKHVPEILATGCFASITVERAGPTRFRTRYAAASRADLERYLAEHTARFREDFAAHFPTGVVAARETWEAVERWAR